MRGRAFYRYPRLDRQNILKSHEHLIKSTSNTKKHIKADKNVSLTPLHKFCTNSLEHYIWYSDMGTKGVKHFTATQGCYFKLVYQDILKPHKQLIKSTSNT